MKVSIFLFIFLKLFLWVIQAFAQEYSSSSYDRYVPLTDRAFDLKVDNLRNQVSSYEERLRRSRIRWNQLFQSQFKFDEKNSTNEMNFVSGVKKKAQSRPGEDQKPGNDNISSLQESLRNNYFLGFTVAAINSQETTLYDGMGGTLGEMEIYLGKGASVEFGRRLQSISFGVKYVISISDLSKDSWYQIETNRDYDDKVDYVSKGGQFFSQAVFLQLSYIQNLTPWIELDYGIGLGYSFNAMKDLPLAEEVNLPDYDMDYFVYNLGLGAKFKMSPKFSFCLSWKYFGTGGSEGSFDAVDAYLAEIGASYYF